MDVTPERSLRLACAQKKRNDVVRLLQEGADPNSELAKDINSGATPLHFACWHGWLDVVTSLCDEHDFDANIVDVEQRTPLHYACRNGHLNIVIFLLKQGCKIDVTDKKKRTPLDHACEKNHIEVVQHFIDQFGITGNSDKTEVLEMACRKGCLEIVKSINVEGNSTCAETLLVTACQNKHMDIASYLIIDKAIPIPESIIDKVVLSACTGGCLELLINLCNQLNCKTISSMRDPDDQQTLFHCACQNGYLDIVHYLTEQKCDPHTVDKYDQTPLHSAAQNGHLQIIQLLIIKLNCKPDVKDSQQRTPLHYACIRGKLDVVQYLVNEHGCNLNQTDENQQTPVAYACQQEHLDILSYFVSKHIVSSDQDKKDILKLACKHGRIDLFENVIKQIDPTCHQFTNGYQHNLLCLACQHGHNEMVNYLITTMQICQPQFKERNDLIPLKLALQKGHKDIMKYFVDNCDMHDIIMLVCKDGELDLFKAIFALIADKYPANEQGCNLSVIDKYGATLLHYASQLGRVHIVDYLISKHKFDPVVRNSSDGTTPLHHACQYGHVHVAEFLISKQACDPEAMDLKCRTPLHLACEYGKLDIVEYLTGQGCIMCIIALDCNQRTPIYHAFKNDHMHIVSFFINKIGDKNYDEANTITVEILNNACEFGRIDLMRILKTLNFTGCQNAFNGERTPLHIACQHGHLDIVKFLMKFPGCNPAAEDIHGQTPLHYALRYSHIDIVHYFISNCDFSAAIKTQVSDVLKAIAAHVNKKPCINKERGELLVLACKVGHVKFFKLFFQDQRDINCDDWNLLHLACKYGHMDIIRYLLGLENNQWDRDDYNRTPLHFACEGGRVGIVQYLIKEQNCNMNVKDNDQLMPLQYAIRNGYFNIVQYLIEEGCDLGKDDSNSIGLLHYAAMFGQKYIASYLITECSFNPEARDRDQKTPVHYAALFGHRIMLQYLLVEHRCCPHAKDKDLWTPLHFTCQGGHLEIINYLIKEQGCDPQCLSRDQEAPLHIASQYDHVNMMHYLIVTENCNPNIRNANGMTPLHFACAHGNMRSIQYLIELGCDPSVTDAEKQTPLHHACKNGFSMVTNFLIKEKNCNSEVKDKHGNTPLLYALQNNHLETIKCLTTLLSVGHYCNGVDTNLDLELLFYFCKHGYTTLLNSITSDIHDWVMCREKNDRTPLHYACIYGHIDIVKYIVLYGDEKNTTGIEVTDMYQLTPLNYACLYGHKDIVEYLATMMTRACADQFLTHFLNTPQGSNTFQDFLFLACKIGHLGFVKLIVEGHKWNPDVYDEDQITPLHYACKGGHEDIVEFLLSTHPNLQYDDKEDVLFFACKCGNFELVVSIVEGQKFNPEVRDQDQQTPFYYACSNQHIFIAQYLANQPVHSIYYRQEALFTACQAGLLGVMKSIINGINEWDPETKDENGDSLLHHACIYGRLNVILYLIGEHHCDPVAKDDDQLTPFDYALQHSHKHVVEHFMDLDNMVYYKDNVKVIDIINKNGFKWLTPLHIACQAGCLAAVNYFITQKGYGPEVRDKNDCTPLHYAAKNYHANVVRYLIDEKNCDPNATDANHLSPLDSVCCNPDANTEQGGDVVRILLSKTSHAKHTNSGNTPLHFACQYNNYVAAGILLSEGNSDPTIKNYVGQTPLELTSSLEILRVFIQSQSAGTEIAYHNLFFIRKEENALKVMKKLIKQNKWDPNTRTSKGENALHFACRSYKQASILYLLSETSCDPNVKNANGITPFLNSPEWVISRPSYIRLFASHDAIDSYIYAIANLDEREALDFAKYLITQGKWDLNEKDSTGKTILHSACRANRPRIVHCLLSEGNCNPNIQDGAGKTPIYYVLNPDIIGHLIKHGADLLDVYSYITSQKEDVSMNIIEHLSYYTTSWNPNRKADSGEIMLHFAIKQEQVKIVAYLLPLAMSDVSVQEDIVINGCKYLSQHNPDWDPNLMTSSGYNALHLACMTNKHTVVHFLLSEMCCDPNMVTKAGYFPLQLTSNPDLVIQLLRHGAKLPNVYQTHGKILGTKEPLKPPVKIFVVGDPSVGKSTLTAALQKELPLLARTFANKRVSGVDEKTAGVVPHEFESRKFGRVTLFDFAGQREFYSSHAALLQNAVKHSSPIFLIVINLIEADYDIKQSISYWASFIGNQCTFVTSKPHIIIVGSHADVLKVEGQDPKQKGHAIDSFCAVSLGFSLEYIGFVPMNCQYFDSTGMSGLRHYLKRSCETLRIPENISFNAHCFQVYLQNKHPDTAAVQIKNVLATISDNEPGTHSDVASFIPSSIHYLLNICEELNERGHIIFLENSDDVKDSWIVLDKAALLSDVTGTIFAPEGFKQHCQLASSTGVVPLQKLKESFPNHSTDMLIGFLSHLEFCHEVIDHEVLKLIEKHQTETLEMCSPDERYFFFPALVRLEREELVWKKSKLYVSGWIMQCSQQQDFFTSRFLQVLLLRLAFSFAMVQSREAIDYEVPAIQRRCSVWKSGIYWGTGHGVEALVEVLPDSKAIIFLVQGSDLLENIKLRSQVLQKIRDCVNDLYQNVEISEGFIDPSIISECPVHVKPSSILHMTEIAEAIILNESDSAVSPNGTPLSLQEFLMFEPFLELGKPLLQHLHNEHSEQRITNEFVGALSNQIKRRDKVCIFHKIFDNNQIQSNDISQAICSWRNQTEGTYKCLKDRLDIFSIFIRRNIYVSSIGLHTLNLGIFHTTNRCRMQLSPHYTKPPSSLIFMCIIV